MDNADTPSAESPQEPEYQTGFGNEFSSEAVPGALPRGQNNPQKPPLGLYTEQLSGTAFTVPNDRNRRTWMYRIRPSVRHAWRFEPADQDQIRSAPCREQDPPIGQLRWNPPPFPDHPTTFLTGLHTIATNGDAHTQTGMAAHIYMATRSMTDSYVYNADGELLIVPQDGGLRVRTECGVLHARPGEILLVPRGMVFAVDLLEETARGYVCENYGRLLELPERGPIGANGLANPRDFRSPVAAFEDHDRSGQLFVKFDGKLFVVETDHSPLDVVAWHGNHVPWVYDLRLFTTMGSISFDHPDPSIFTVLTSPSPDEGIANIDVVIFGDRWLVGEHTFRPPWYHKNIMSEFMGILYGVYDAKEEGFEPGGMSLHNSYFPHGPDHDAWIKATTSDLEPQKLADTMSFMFETRYPLIPTAYAGSIPALQDDYPSVWHSLERHFDRRTP
ncbi:homogentisate 1,2-dioxygenase [Euzebya tangerina]|uniref:homogentisate 1,2-dioxygenase n=1 Tax=Euzebya tangerina TaxID=591198 RepID=UPI000E30F3B1|nr:homogentisate 1,2-dioxygenase [Euzebya tangerina]